MSVRNTVKAIQDVMRQDAGVDGDAQRLSQLCWMFFLKIIDDQDQALELLHDGYLSPIPPRLQWRRWAADPEGLTGEALLDFVHGDLFPTLKNLPARGPWANRARVVRGVFEDAYSHSRFAWRSAHRHHRRRRHKSGATRHRPRRSVREPARRAHAPIRHTIVEMDAALPDGRHWRA
ncbi:MAG: hypothetical protein AMXMBFR25_09920 [Lysobacterales bacterium]|nr:hypothetical protein [Xanthomonadales bacterium]